MSNLKKQAKAKLNTEVGTFEIEGSEEFVKDGIAELVKLIKKEERDSSTLPKKANQIKRRVPKKKRASEIKNATQPKLISDLIPKDKIEDLKSFFEEKNPGNHQEAYTVLAYWMKYNLDLDVVSIDEIWTTHKILGRKGPNRWLQVFRDIKSRKGWLDSSDSREGGYYITPMGETFVEHDLPHKKGN